MGKAPRYDLAIALEYAPATHQGSTRAQIAVGPRDSQTTQTEDRHEQQGRERAPKVTVKGGAESADWLVATARAIGVPVIEEGCTAKLLNDVPLDTEIPPQFYRAVALILHGLSLNRSPLRL